MSSRRAVVLPDDAGRPILEAIRAAASSIRVKMFILSDPALVRALVAAIVGSINVALGSLDDRRELAFEVRDDEVVHRLHRVARHDWKDSHPLDLSDEGLREDLEERVEEARKLGVVHAKPFEDKRA